MVSDQLIKSKSIFLTGATGFLGGRVVERLIMQHHVYPTCLVHNPSHMARIARFKVPVVFGNVLTPDKFETKVSGCDVFIHTAYGKERTPEESWVVDVEGTEKMLKLAVDTKIKHFIFISTVAVYEESFSSGTLDEKVIPVCKGRNYPGAKLKAESLCFEYSQRYNLPITILRPAIIYGPFAPYWTIAPYVRIKEGLLKKYMNFDGICNAVYIDDVVSTILECICNQSAYNEVFNIGGEDKVTWNQFLDFYSQLAIGKPLPEGSMTSLRARYFFNRSMKKLAKLPYVISPGLTTSIYSSLHEKIGLLEYVARVAEYSPNDLKYYKNTIIYPMDKIKNRIKHRDIFSFVRGSQLTGDWLKNSGY